MNPTPDLKSWPHRLMGALSLCLALGHAAAQGPAAVTPAASASPASAPAALPWVEADVRKIDAPQGKLTLRHGPLPHLDMGAMTMVFRVARPELLQGLQVGAAVRVQVQRVQGQLTITALQPR